MPAKPMPLRILPPNQTLFRHHLVSQVVARRLGGESLAAAVQAVASRAHASLDGRLERVSPRTLYRWVAAYQAQGLDGLSPAQRPRIEGSRVLSEELVGFCVEEKTRDPKASVPEVIRRAVERNLIASHEDVDRTTLWRVCQRQGLATRLRASKHEGDARRFAYPHRMMMVLADGKHFRAGPQRVRRVALFFLDDATRYGLHVVVGTSEHTELFLRGVYELICRHGLMGVLFLDGGPGFKSDDTRAVITRLPGVLLVIGAAGYPEGHGKIERFNRTADAAVLRSLDRAAEVDPALGALELRLGHYLDQYNDRPHEALGGLTPRQAWERDTQALRFPDNLAALRACFAITETRKVSADHILQLGGVDFEVPRGLARQLIDVERHVLDGSVTLVHAGKRITLAPVDLAANATSRRGGKAITAAGTSAIGEALPKTAATLAYERSFGPIVDATGGFSTPDSRAPGADRSAAADSTPDHCSADHED